MLELLGLLMFASWIWTVAILFQRVKDTTPLEKGVFAFASLSFVLYLIGSLSE